MTSEYHVPVNSQIFYTAGNHYVLRHTSYEYAYVMYLFLISHYNESCHYTHLEVCASPRNSL
jgi:hypothetical protein